MDTINKLIATFSNPDRIKFEDNKLTITSLGNKKVDYISFGSFSLFVIAVYIIASDTSSSPIIYIPVLFFILVTIYIFFYVLSKGDNVVCIDFYKMEILIKRRSPIFKIFPAIKILFRDINCFATKTEIDVGESFDMISHDVYLEKNIGFFKRIVLIRFDKTENNSANHFLGFIKKSITGTWNKREAEIKI